jgi:hypothetical protein
VQYTIAYVHLLADVKGVLVDSIVTLFPNLATRFVSATDSAALRTRTRAVYARVHRYHSKLRRTRSTTSWPSSINSPTLLTLASPDSSIPRRGRWRSGRSKWGWFNHGSNRI